jgi:hypothetical protein
MTYFAPSSGLIPLAKLSFKNLPPSLVAHIKQRALERDASYKDLLALQRWVNSEPEAPDGYWWKDFGSFKLCGVDGRPSTILEPHMAAHGTELK